MKKVLKKIREKESAINAWITVEEETGKVIGELFLHGIGKMSVFIGYGVSISW